MESSQLTKTLRKVTTIDKIISQACLKWVNVRAHVLEQARHEDWVADALRNEIIPKTVVVLLLYKLNRLKEKIIGNFTCGKVGGPA